MIWNPCSLSKMFVSKKCVEWNFWQIAQKKNGRFADSQFVKNLWRVRFVETLFLTTCNDRQYWSERTSEGLRATLRPRGRHCFPLVTTFSANREIFGRSVKNSLFCRQIMIQHFALRQIAMHPMICLSLTFVYWNCFENTD